MDARVAAPSASLTLFSGRLSAVVWRLRPDGGGAYVANGFAPSLVTLSPAAMPRVVANQRERFDNDELFRKLSRDMEASI